MKLSTKIIIGLAALTVIGSFLFFIIIGKVAEHYSKTETYSYGPVRTLRIQSPNMSDFVFKCDITSGDENTVNYSRNWPVTGKAELTYNPADSSLTVVGVEGKDGIGVVKVDITVGPELDHLIVDGNSATVSLDAFVCPAMVVDADNSTVVLNSCSFGSLLASAKNDDIRVVIDHSSKIDSLFYNVSSADAISFYPDSIGAMIAMPGSVKIDSDEETFDAEISSAEED